MTQTNPIKQQHIQTNKIMWVAKFQAMFRLPRDISPIWLLPAFSMVLCLLVPILTIFKIAFYPEENIWPHLYNTVLGGYISDTLILVVGVGSLTLVIGVLSAWLVTMYNFPGRNIASKLLLLPLAMPSYIIAYCYVEIFDYSNFIQSSIRQLGGFNSAKDYWFFEIRSMGGAIFVLSIVLYPYIYLTSRAAFLQQSVCLLEASRMLGKTTIQSFFKVALPLARPAIFVGLTLALMECLNDVGAVEFFGVNTLTVGIYSTWLERGNLGGGAQIALVLLAFIFILIIVEKLARRGAKYSHTTRQIRPIKRIQLAGKHAIYASIFCLTPIVLGFLLPFIQLLHDSLEFVEVTDYFAFIGYAKNSLILSAIAALLAVIIGLFLSYSERIFNIKLLGWMAKLASVGYAIPGVILGLGIFISLIAFDDIIGPILEWFGYAGASQKMLLSGSIFAIIFAYLVRFLAVSYGAIETGFGKIPLSYDHAAKSLGHHKNSILRKIHLPLIRPALATALILTFIDSMKELPATLILRPFNFDTLATHVYEIASLEIFEEAAIAALFIVLIGLIPVYLLNKMMAVPNWRDGK